MLLSDMEESSKLCFRKKKNLVVMCKVDIANNKTNLRTIPIAQE